MVVGVGSKNITGSFIQVIEQQGWQGLWAGNMINMLRIIPTQAIELGTFECTKRAMTSAQEKWKQNEGPKLQIGFINLNLSLSWISPVAVAGAAAGIASTLSCHPLEVLKDRLTVSPEAYPNLGVAIRNIYKDGGIGAFYAGISPTLVACFHTAPVIILCMNNKESYCQFQKRKKNVFESSRNAFSWSSSRCPPNMAAALSEVVREEGLKGLYRGWVASCLKVMPSSGIHLWMFYEVWKDILLVQKGFDID
ncbi:Mitochondrial substrate/solute carrier [Sesbania bispinosa]|nr:Mitochondrial substrate/solute carrier [Sesbania bispinosa]